MLSNLLFRFFKFYEPRFQILLENIHWQADSGLTCFEFAENKWCENGGVGSAWNDSWTWEKDSEGLDARKACLTCGAKGGIDEMIFCNGIPTSL